MFSFADQTVTFQDGTFPAETLDCCGIDVLNHPFLFQTMLYPFTFGVPFTIELSATANLLASPGEMGRATVNVDFDGLQILDQNHNPDENAYIVSDSGETYSSPEPASFFLSGTLIGAFVCFRFRSKTRVLTRVGLSRRITPFLGVLKNVDIRVAHHG
jgi:hypothetical protein